jgi:RNA polymerase sigma-70 factor, ECF subfamily
MGDILSLPFGTTGVRSPPPLPYAPLASAGPSFDPLAMLLAETAAGHERAFARLYELTGGRLISIARGIVGRTDLAEEVLQESLLRIWRSAHQYDPAKGPAYAWLVTVVRNRALSAKVKLQRLEHGRDELDAEKLVFDGPDPAAQAMRSEEARRVNSCLANLPLNHRKSVALVYFEGLTHQELAQRLDVRLGTAKSWVRRGLTQMGQCLGNQADADWRASVAAEYAVGALQGTARRGFERRRERDARFCRAADLWERQLAMLTEFLPDSGPAPAHVWTRIEQRIARDRIAFSRPLFWQMATGALTAVILALIAVVLAEGER